MLKQTRCPSPEERPSGIATMLSCRKTLLFRVVGRVLEAQKPAGGFHSRFRLADGLHFHPRLPPFFSRQHRPNNARQDAIINTVINYVTNCLVTPFFRAGHPASGYAPANIPGYAQEERPVIFPLLYCFCAGMSATGHLDFLLGLKQYGGRTVIAHAAWVCASDRLPGRGLCADKVNSKGGYCFAITRISHNTLSAVFTRLLFQAY